MASLVPHRYIVSVRIEEDEESREPVNIVTTKLNVNPASPDFDNKAMEELRQYVEAWQREHFERVTIEGPV